MRRPYPTRFAFVAPFRLTNGARHRSDLDPQSVHARNENAIWLSTAGLFVNGMLLAIRQIGPRPCTGGDFGPEAGLIGMVALALGSLAVVAYVPWSRARASRCGG